MRLPPLCFNVFSVVGGKTVSVRCKRLRVGGSGCGPFPSGLSVFWMNPDWLRIQVGFKKPIKNPCLYLVAGSWIREYRLRH